MKVPSTGTPKLTLQRVPGAMGRAVVTARPSTPRSHIRASRVALPASVIVAAPRNCLRAWTRRLCIGQLLAGAAASPRTEQRTQHDVQFVGAELVVLGQAARRGLVVPRPRPRDEVERPCRLRIR